MMLGKAELLDEHELTLINEQYREELRGAVESVAAGTNRYAGEISIFLFCICLFPVLTFMTGVIIDSEKWMEHNGAPERTTVEVSLMWAAMEGAGIAAGWFWGRHKLRHWFWRKMNPGQPLDFVRKSKRFQGAFRLLAMLILWLVIYLSFKMLI